MINARPRRYLLARHGQTNYNKEHRVQGTLDEGVILTHEGIAQASALGVYVANRQLLSSTDATIEEEVSADTNTIKDDPITRTYCSPMQRCRQTFEAISNVCSDHAVANENPSPSNNVVHHYHPLPEPIIITNLHEIQLCEWQGRLRKDVAIHDTTNWNIFKSQPTALRLQKGTFAPVLDCWERGKSNWDIIRSQSMQNGDGVIFIICHGAIGQAMLLYSLGLDIELYGRSKRFGFDNCDCFEVEWWDGEEVARRWRRVYPVEGRWEMCSSTRKMYSGGLASSR